MTAQLVVIPPGEDCNLQGRDLTGKIVLVGNFTCDEKYQRVSAMEAAGAIVSDYYIDNK